MPSQLMSGISYIHRQIQLKGFVAEMFQKSFVGSMFNRRMSAFTLQLECNLH